MPELPDVEVFKQYLDANALHKKIDDVEVREKRLLENISAKKLKEKITGKKFKSSRRHGKHLFVKVDGGALVLHFGMTGKLHYYQDADDEPDHARVIFHYTNGYHLAYQNMRMFGKVTFTDDIDDFIEKKELGPDAANLSFDEFTDLMESKSSMVKSAFMDQSLMSGMGNIYSDEALYQAKIHPKRQTGDLSEAELKTLYDKMMHVLEEAIKRQVTEFPDSFLINHRKEGADCPGCGGEVKKIKVSSRSTYYCPDCQK